MVGRNTKISVSIAQRPGTFGVEFHNEGYKLLGLDQIYLALKVEPNDLESFIGILKDNFHTCSVSMPHKIKIMEYLDLLDETAEKTQSVNTIVKQDDQTLIGYNTDVFGAKKALEVSGLDLYGKKVLMVGAGGVARAVGYAVKELGGNLTITNRTLANAENLGEKLNASFIPLENIEDFSGYLIINATSVGMGDHETIVSSDVISKFDGVMDVVVGDTEIIKQAKLQNKIIIRGGVMTTYQAAKQFELYTGKELPSDFISKKLKKYLN